jgi:hypothetical protein
MSCGGSRARGRDIDSRITIVQKKNISVLRKYKMLSVTAVEVWRNVYGSVDAIGPAILAQRWLTRYSAIVAFAAQDASVPDDHVADPELFTQGSFLLAAHPSYLTDALMS